MHMVEKESKMDSYGSEHLIQEQRLARLGFRAIGYFGT